LRALDRLKEILSLTAASSAAPSETRARPDSAPGSYADLLSRIKLSSSDVAIDCGANVGEITARMASTGATVFAFEPNPYAFQVLQQRFAAMPNVRCIPKGVWDHHDRLRLYLHENAGQDQVHWSTGSSLLAYKGNVNPTTYIEVEVVDLAQFIVDLGCDIKVVKIDVEGVECPIINRLIDVGVMKRIGLLVAETHEKKIPELRAETEKLRRRIVKERLTNIWLDWI